MINSHLPDIVSDCEDKCLQTIIDDKSMKITCKQIAHSLRIVADQMDKKYCQDIEFHQNLNYLSLRILFQSYICTLWTRSLLPYLVLFCKTKLFFY